MNTEAYLHRIGMERPSAPTLEALQALTRAHLKSVPFENLEVTDEHREPDLDPSALYEKIVLRRRGGYCFELNKLFYLLLCSLGFECYPIAARVIHKRQEPCPLSHRATIVVIESQRYCCDVGFGGAGPKGVLSMETEDIQVVAGERFTIRPDNGTYVISNLEEGEPERVLRFRDEPWLDIDFQTLSRYYAAYPGSPFRSKRILYLCTQEGWISLTDTLFTTREKGVKTSITLETQAEIEAVIAERFGLALPKCAE